MVYIKDDLIIINNPFENKLFIYDRINRQNYEINEDTYSILEDIKKNKYSFDKLNEKYGEEFIQQLFELEIITNKKQKNINNVKKLTKYNNVRLFIELTNKCNLKCKHCYGGFACTNNEYIDFECLKKFIDKASEACLYQVDITGGEPTLYPHFEELLEYLYYAGMKVRIFTNLTTFNENIKNSILKYGVEEIVTSIDSCIPEDHDDFRGKKGGFEKTINSIKILQDNNVEVVMNTMIGNHNKNHINELVDFINNAKVKSVLDVIVPEGRAKDLNEDLLESARIIKRIYDINSSNVDREAVSVSCGVGNRFVYIRPDGNIYLCPSLIKEEYKIGNIMNSEIEEIWSILKKKYSNLSCSKKNDKCKKCSGGCRARALKIHNDINEIDDVYCIINGVMK